MTAPLLKPMDAARRLQVSRTQAYRLIQHGEIETVRIGASVRVSEDALAAYIGRCTNRAKRTHLRATGT